MYVECFNGDKGLIEWTDGHRFKIYGNLLSKMDIKRFAIVKSDREKAIEWWNSISVFEKGLLIHDTFNPPLNQRTPEEVTGREIEQIWRKETQQELERVIVIIREERPQVGFEGLYKYISAMNQLYDTVAIQNLCLFFDLLSKSSTFANKAHKSLNKLMK